MSRAASFLAGLVPMLGVVAVVIEWARWAYLVMGN